ncbi:NUF1 protein [Scheffersomyces coipomensis]|uniref:NUF1 protein n=1 Tax=Scheffersomyces coipomensis TaxID=1788519 RepID=UPI00315D1368
MSDDDNRDTTDHEESKVSKDSQNPSLPQLNNQETIIQRLRDIPIDKLKEIITNQIDLEIRLKHKELKLTEQEIGKIESQMLILRKFFEIPNNVKIDNEPNEFTLKYFDLLNKSLTLTYNDVVKNQNQIPVSSAGEGLFKADYLDHESSIRNDYNPYGVGHSYRTRSTTSSLRPSHYTFPVVQSESQTSTASTTTATAAVTAATISTAATAQIPSPGSSISTTASSISAPVPIAQNFVPARITNQHLGCLYRRTDGVIVKLTCPDCQRSNFSSAQGFLNHSRIAHSKEYTSQDAAALKCGSIIPEIKQEPNGERSIQRLIERGIDPNKNINVNEIYFNGYTDTYDDPSNNSSARNSTTGPNTRNSSVESNTIKSENVSLHDVNVKPPSEGELLKKIIKEGKMNKEDYEKLVDETKKPLNNVHLFDDEFEEEDTTAGELESGASTTNLSNLVMERSKLKRRKSRGGINITVTRGDSGLEIQGDDEDEGDDDEDDEEGKNEQVTGITDKAPIEVNTTSKESSQDIEPEPETKRKRKS